MLSLTKVFCYRAIHHSFIRLPPDHIVFLGIIKHGELDIRLAYAVKRRIFISLIIVVLLIIISFSLPKGYLYALVSFRIIIYHRLCGLSFYLWYKIPASGLYHRFHNSGILKMKLLDTNFFLLVEVEVQTYFGHLFMYYSLKLLTFQ